MSKTKEPPQTAIATAAPAPLAPYDSGGRGYQLEGGSSEDILLPSVILHQGDISEKQYGPGKKGSLLENLTNTVLWTPPDGWEKTKLAVGPKFVFTRVAWVEYGIWQKDENGIPRLTARTRNRNEIPPGGLEWQTGPDGKRVPPIYDTIQTYIVWFEGQAMPAALKFYATKKSKSLRDGRSLNTCEMMLQGSGRPNGIYSLNIKLLENAKGRFAAYYAVPAGTPTPEQVEMANSIYDSIKSRKVTLRVQETEDFIDADSDEPNMVDNVPPAEPPPF